MNEYTKTLAFVGVAAGALLAGYIASRPAPSAFDPEIEIGKEFFPDFTNAQSAAKAEITSFDSSSDEKHDLTVALVDGVWEINPDKQGYPEVNVDRLADAIDAVIGLKKQSVVTDDPTMHREYGVVDPDNEAELREGSGGVGKRVDVVGDNGSVLAALIVGKADKDETDVHFVRQPGRDRVYRTVIDDDKLTSRFEDWVGADLLGASGGDLRQVSIQDYGIDLTAERQAPMIQNGQLILPQTTLELVNRSKALLAKKPSTKPDVTTDQWQVEDFQTYDKEKKAFVERKLEANEEVEAFKLSDLGRKLGSIKVVDVARKPELLAKDLASEKDFLTNAESPVRGDRASITDLLDYGFQPRQVRDSNDATLVCFEGEMNVGFANGVEYVLRFGDITGNTRGADEGEDKPADDKPAEGAETDAAAKGSNTAPNRYLMVSARFNQSLIPKPKLEELPPVEEPKAKEPAGDEKPADEKPAAKPDEKKVDEKADDTKADDKAKEPTKVEPDDEADEDDKALAADADEKPAADKEPEKQADEKPAMTPEERKRIEVENKSKQEKYDEQVKAGKEKAKELNAKFAEWFYVISDATYQGLNVDPAGLLRKNEPKAEGAEPSTPDLPKMPLLPSSP